MPLIPLSDRQSTVAYAIDLLRAHQIRRENVFLHEQLKTCLGEVRDLKANNITATVTKEIKNLQASSEANNNTVKKALALANKAGVLFDEQSREFEVIQQTCRLIQSDVSNIKTSNTQAVEDGRAKTTLLDTQIQATRANCQSLVAAQNQQAHQIQITFESFQTALDEKADTSMIAALENGLDEVRVRLPAARVALPSVSRVSESVQVRDSQHPNDQDETATLPEPLDPLADLPKPAETVLDDLDLDANVHTISYAGHQRDTSQQIESLDMLPPSTAQATQLTRVKALRQRRFEDWTLYYEQGQKLLENLPSSFEDTVVHNFVDGIFRVAHRNQCRQWLDSNGWNWANITTFGDLSSQVRVINAKNAVAGAPEQLTPPRKIRTMLAEAATTEEFQEGRKRMKSRKPGQVAAREPLRRGQRLVEKDSLVTHLHESPVPGDTIPPSVEPVPRDADDHVIDKGSGTRLDNTPEGIAKEKSTGKSFLQKHQPRNNHEEGQIQLASVSQDPVEALKLAAPKSTKRKTEATAVEPPPKRVGSNRRSDHGIAKDQLMQAERSVAQPIAESSDDQGFLYKDNPPKPATSVKGGGVRSKRRPAKYHAYGAGRRHKTKQKQQQLPLPPPPEIPILDTTDEE